MSRSLKVILITLISFGVYFFLSNAYFSEWRKLIDLSVNEIGISHLIVYILVGLPIIIGASLINEFKRIPATLGLNRSILKGILFPLLCTLPMFIGFSTGFSFNKGISLDEFLIAAVAAAFFEELFFRSFLFGQLFRYTKLGFIPAVLLGSCLFAVMHLYQSHDLTTLVGVFSTTFMGAVLFAWLFTEWNYNLWIPVFLHFFMNLAWMLFSVSDNAFGNAYANIFRILTIAFAITLTILFKRKRNLPLSVNRNTIWMKCKG